MRPALYTTGGGIVFDLYTFPEDHVGRKTFVHVDGHKKSVAVVYTYKGTDRRNHILPEFGGTDAYFADGTCASFMPDMSAYHSPLDGSFITSRPQHQMHMRKHGVIEVGNERLKAPADRAPIRQAGTDIKRAMEVLGNR